MTSITIETKFGHCEVSMHDDHLTIDEMVALFEQALSGIGYHWTGNIELISEYDIKISSSTQN